MHLSPSTQLWATPILRTRLNPSMILLLYDTVVASLDLNTQNIPERDLLPTYMQPTTWTRDSFLS